MGYVVAGICVLMVSGLAACGQSTRQTERARPKTHTVRMEGMVFQPASLTISAGDSVVWVNKDLVPHAAAATEPAFDSRAIAFDNSWKHAFSAPGEVNYVCPFHPTMIGTLQVR